MSWLWRAVLQGILCILGLQAHLPGKAMGFSFKPNVSPLQFSPLSWCFIPKKQNNQKKQKNKQKNPNIYCAWMFFFQTVAAVLSCFTVNQCFKDKNMQFWLYLVGNRHKN